MAGLAAGEVGIDDGDAPFGWDAASTRRLAAMLGGGGRFDAPTRWDAKKGSLEHLSQRYTQVCQLAHETGTASVTSDRAEFVK